MVFIFLLLKIPDRETTKLPLKAKLSQLDFLGTSVLIPAIVCLLLALQWGGLTYAWSDGRIIALLTLAGVLIIAFIAIQILLPKTATIPPHIFVQRSILAGFWATLCIGAQMMIFVYYLPIWFQAIQDVSAVDSGIRLLPLTLSMVLTSIATGVVTSKTGYYTPPMLIGTCIMAVGSGLLTTLTVNSGPGMYIGYQIVWGLGMGMTFQAPNLAAQTVLKQRDVPIGTSLVFFSQLMGGAIFISVGQNVLNNQLLERLTGLPGFSPALISANGATTLRTVLPANLLEPVLIAYNDSLQRVFQVGLIMTCLTILGAAAMEWKSVKKNKKNAEATAAAEQGESKAVDEKLDDEAVKSDADTAVEKRTPSTADPEKETRTTDAASPSTATATPDVINKEEKV
jgi:hypothetical protein